MNKPSRFLLFLLIFKVSIILAENTRNGKITGGYEARPHSNPYVVSLQSRFLWWRYRLCSGSILSERWILSAGHCVTDSWAKWFAMDAVIGAHNLAMISSSQIYPISERIAHPRYRGGVGPYDIGMMKTARKIKFSKTVQPINLPTKNPTFSKNDELLITGWGALQSSLFVVELPNKLQEAEVTYLPFHDCYKAVDRIKEPYEPNPLKQIANICTGPISGGIAGCTGDSGGPLVQYIDSEDETTTSIATDEEDTTIVVPSTTENPTTLSPTTTEQSTTTVDSTSVPSTTAATTTAATTNMATTIPATTMADSTTETSTAASITTESTTTSTAATTETSNTTTEGSATTIGASTTMTDASTTMTEASTTTTEGSTTTTESTTTTTVPSTTTTESSTTTSNTTTTEASTTTEATTMEAPTIEISTTSEPRRRLWLNRRSTNGINSNKRRISHLRAIKTAKKPTVVGVLSWGVVPCGRRGAPTVYTNVTNYLDFINKHLHNS